MIRIIDVARFQGPGLEADLAGRDFTVNAMALEVTRDPPRLIDPHDGRADLAARRLRAVSDRSIRNDPVRGLRGVRLAAQLGFEIEPRTRSLIQAAAAGLALVSAERIQEELVKILSTPGVAHSLRELDELGLLPEVLPEVSALKGVAQSRPHRWNAYEHTLQVVVALEDLLPLEGDRFHTDVPFPDRVARHLSTPVAGGGSRRTLLSLAGLLHDVGKRETAAVEPDGRTRFFNHERVGADMAAGMMRRLRFSGESLRLVETIVLYHLRPLQLAWAGGASRRAIHRLFCDAGDAGVEIVLLSLADHRATVGPGALDEEYPVLLEVVRALLEAYFHRQATVVSPPPLLTGRDLLRCFNLPPGPDIGRLLNELKEAQAAGEVTTREEAEDWVRRKIG